MTSPTGGDRVAERALWLVVGAGVLVRVYHFLANRSLWLDEAMLALNVSQRSFWGLTQPLDFNQAAPLGFLWLEKLAVTVLGTSEPALRLWPLLASLAALFLFAGTARRLLAPRVAVLVVALFALSASLTYYAAEVKQYSFDVLLACAVLWIASREEAGGNLSFSALAAFGAVGVWFSHPFAFLLPGLALGLALTDRKVPSGGTGLGVDRARARQVAALGLVWAISFLAAYLWMARDVSRSPLMARFWAEGFMPVPPTSSEELRWYLEAFAGWVRNVFDFTETVSPARSVAIAVAGVFSLVGVAAAWVHRRRHLVVVLGPIVIALLVSALGLYPFRGRLILFLVPSTLLLVGWGLEPTIFGTARPGSAESSVGDLAPARAILQVLGGLAAALLLISGGAILAEWLQRPAREELRPVLEYVAERIEPGDVVYLHSGAQHGALFYERVCPACRLNAAEVIRGRFQAGSDEAIAGDLARLPATGRVWLVFAHEWWGYGDAERLRMTRILGSRTSEGGPIDVREEPGARAFLFDLDGR